MQHPLRNPFVKGKQSSFQIQYLARKNNESADSVQKNTNSAISHRTGASRGRVARSRARGRRDWNLISSNAIVATAGQPPPVSALSFAMVQGAVYDAVNAIDRGYQPYLPEPPSNPTDSKEAATAAAAFRVLVGFDDLPGLFPSQQPTLQPLYDSYIAGLPDDPTGIES